MFMLMRILIVEDEKHNREVLKEILEKENYEVVLACDGREALQFLEKISFDLVLSDIRMPHMDGVELFRKYQKNLKKDFLPNFVFMTAYGRLDEAVELLRQGAIHFLTKPLRKKDILGICTEVLKYKQNILQDKGRQPAKNRSKLIYRSRSMGEIESLIHRVAPTMASVLITGESGTGKELVARQIHEESPRHAHPFVALNAAALPDGLLESELFGHEKGAFTGADQSAPGLLRSSHGGTFFLDECGNMPLSLQAKLLRVIQDREVLPLGATEPVHCDIRWIAAANQNLEVSIKNGSFREDLLFRLKVVGIEIPPLRERKEDLQPLMDYFIAQFMGEFENKQGLEIPEATQAILYDYSWPGNVRELKNVLERAFVLAQDGVFHKDYLPSHILNKNPSLSEMKEFRFSMGTTLKDVEDTMIEATLKACGGDKTQAAQILGINPRTLYRWLDKHEEI